MPKAAAFCLLTVQGKKKKTSLVYKILLCSEARPLPHHTPGATWNGMKNQAQNFAFDLQACS